jgi:6-phosphofructokinase 1
LKYEGRSKAALNLIKKGISNLIIIGGDGSLTGANIFKNEWKSIVDEHLKNETITKEMMKSCHRLNIVGIVGSIDNDFCGADITLGANTALHRIVEAIDSIESTAFSHKRTFIMEVMGRHCGYLALASAISGEADYLFVPETPVPSNWRDKLCDTLSSQRKGGERVSLVIVSEGATDLDGNAITSMMVKDAITEKLQHDTKITVLGHVQRGGEPSHFDLILAARLGSEAVLTILELSGSEQEQEAKVVVMQNNRVVAISLNSSIEKTKILENAMSEKNYEHATALRGKHFSENLGIFKNSLKFRSNQEENKNSLNFAIMHVGSPACGMNATVHSFVRSAINEGHKVYGIYGGFDGLIKGDLKLIEWLDVYNWVRKGSAMLWSSETLPYGHFPDIEQQLKKFNIDGLVAIGGFEAYLALGQLYDQRSNFEKFKIPLCVIPACIANNVPGSEFSIGADTSLNELKKTCISLRLAGAYYSRAYIVEIMGNYCGYLTTLCGLAIGADSIYIPEEELQLSMITRDLEHMKNKVKDGVHRGLILRNQKASENYSTDFIRRLFSEEGKGSFSCRGNIFGHWQLGGVPSPFDRNLGFKMGSKAFNWMNEIILNRVSESSEKTACVLGLNKNGYTFTPLKQLHHETDFK